MVQAGNGFRFPLKTFAKLTFDKLDGDGPIQARVPGTSNSTHATHTNRSLDYIRPEFVAGFTAMSYQLYLSRLTSLH